MRNIVLIVASCLFLVGTTLAENVMVTSEGEPSFQSLRITTIVDSKALPGAKIDIYERQTKKYSLATDTGGVLVVPELDPGVYSIVAASADARFHGYLALQVSKSSKGQISSFFINLTNNSAQLNSLRPLTAGELAAAANKAVNTRIQQFIGVLVDPTGAPIPGGNIVVRALRSAGAIEIIELKSGADGQFSAPLAEGAYIAIFSSPGFRNEVTAFEIGKDATKTLHVALRVGQF